ncbi:MAG: DJ-1/PfpI family protein [Pseudomonadota bacterium]
MDKKRNVGVLVFDGFETLDVMGPIELFGMHADAFSMYFVAEELGNVTSSQGQAIVAEREVRDDAHYDIVLVPGGLGTRQAIHNEALMSWIKRMSASAEILSSVCTGSALLAKAGALDGKRATSNKMSFAWVKEQGPSVNWVNQARWVEDGKVFTSSGVSAGMDMTLAVIARLLGEAAAEDAALRAEYTWQRDATQDPFAAAWGLIEE